MAAGSSRDVELVIRARDESTKAVQSIADALKILAGAQDDVGKSATKTDGLLGELGSALAGLQKEAQALNALATVANQLDRAGAAVTRLENSTRTAGEGVAQLQGKYEELAQAGAQLAARLGETRSAMESEAASVRQTTTAQGLLASQIVRLGVEYAKTITSLKRAKEPNDALSATYRQQRDQLIGLAEQQNRNERTLAEQQGTLTATQRTFSSLNKEILANSTAQERMARDVSTANEVFDRQQANLERSRAELAGMSETGEQAAKSLGGIAVSTEAVGAAQKATGESIAAVTEALKRQQAAGSTSTGTASSGPAAGATAAYRAQIEAVQAARKAWEEAQAAATKLGREMAATEAPTSELRAAFLLSRTAAEGARQAYVNQAGALNTLKGVTQGGYQAFEQIAGAMATEERAAEATARALRDIPDISPQIRPLSATLGELFSWLFKIPSASEGASNGIKSVGSSAGSSAGLISRLRGEVLGLASGYIGLYAAAQQVGGVIKTVADVEAAQARLSLVYDGNRKAAQTDIQNLMGQAERLGIPFNELATTYTKVAIAGHEMGFEADSTRKIFIAMAEAGRVSGLSANEMSGVFLGLSRSIDRGVLNARNFNMEIGARIPGSMKAMADALGIGIGKFNELQRASGGIAANESTLNRFAANLTKEFAGALPASLDTVNAELGRFKTYIQEAQLAIGQGGFTAALKNLLSDLGVFLKSNNGAEAFKAIGAALGSLTTVIDFAAKNFDILVAAAKAFVAIQMSRYVLSLVTGAGGLSVSLKTAAVDVARLEAAFAGLSVEKLSASFTSFRAQVVASGIALAEMGPQGVIAAGGMAVASAATTVFRGVLVGITAVARAMWIAVGGFPGLIITGITFVLSSLLGEWISGVNEATTAMDAHDAIMGKVRDDYEKTGEAAGKLADKFKDVSSIQIFANTANLRSQLDELKKSASNAPYDLRIVGGGESNDTFQQLQHIIDAFKSGKISASDFKAAVNGLAEADPHLDRTIVLQLLDTADKAAKAEHQIKENDAALRVIRGTASDADRAMLGLATSLHAVNGALSTTALDAYSDSLEKMAKLAPDLKKGVKASEDAEAAQADLKSSLQALKLSDDQVASVVKGNAAIPGLTAEQQAKVKEAYDLYKQVVADITAREQKAQDDALPSDTSSNLRQRIERLEGTAKNPASSATGAGQFTNSTWLDQFNKVFPALIGMTDEAKLAMRSQKAAADKMLDELIRHNQGQLARAGIAPTDGNTYLAHFLGAGGAIKMILANPKDIAAAITPAAARSNPNVFAPHGRERTAGDLRNWAATQMGGAAGAGTQGSAEGSKILADGRTVQEKFNESLVEFVRGLDSDTGAINQSSRQAFINSKVREQEAKAQQDQVDFSSAQRTSIADAAGRQFDATAAQEARRATAELTLELNKLTHGQTEQTQAEYIATEATKSHIDVMSLEGQKWATLTGQIFDAQKQQAAYNSVVGLDSQRKALVGELNEAFKEGDVEKQHQVRQDIDDITAKIKDALPDARAFALALGDTKMQAALDRVNLDLQKTKVGLTDAKTINTQLASGLTNAFGQATTSLGKFLTGATNLKGLLGDIGKAFLNFAAEFLQHIAEMILQQTLLNLLMKSPIGGFISNAVNVAAGAAAQTSAATGSITTSAAEAGAAAAASTAQIPIIGPELAVEAGVAIEGLVLSTFLPQVIGGLLHAGGLVGAAGGQNRTVMASIFDGAIKMHGGGIAGLLPDEVPTILKRNEEVLTESNPRHIGNIGKGGGSPAPAQPMSVKVVNAFDHATVLSEGLNTIEGQQAVMNFVRKNPRAFNQALKSGGS